MNQTLDIAIAQSRWQKVWSNEIWDWSKILKKLSSTHRTAETYSAYMAAPKQRQAEIKDIGGFVGGYLLEGLRHKGNVKYRQLLALDIDYGYPDLWADFIMYYPNEAACYSTHAHSVVAPRLRLVIPLSRIVNGEEYEAIGRKIAGTIGMRHFDPTTFQPERLMYWPSTSKDAEYYFRHQKGEWLSPDDVLKEYRDWHNVSEWPLCPSENEIVKTDLKRQEDPLEKEGIIGAFCRSYSISEAIEEFIPETYTPAGDDRYTYSEGTTAAGAICYEDKFLYSHHSTDPIAGQLCNAFDLVRIHKYGNLDLDTSLSITKRPSFAKMTNLARTDAKVIHELGIFNLDPQITVGDTEWLKTLEADKRGNYLPTIDNFLKILRNDPNIKGKLSANEFDYRLYVKGGVPWNGATKLRELDDDDEAGIRHYFEQKYGMYHTAKSKDAFALACKDSPFHPVKDYLNGLVWDGIPRLDTLFIDQLGVPDSPYTRAVTRKSLVAAVARVMRPGIKYDYMPVAIGAQGKGKSSLLFDLGKEWFSDTLDSVTGKEAYMQIQGAWLIELAELSAVKKAEVEAVKHFISKREDRYRVPFSRHNAIFKRQGVFFGSTNDTSFLKDATGNRRFWPLVVTKKYKPGSIDPDPIWAEAVHFYKQGEELYLSEELEAMAAEQQLVHTEVDERAGVVERYLEMRVPVDWESWAKIQRVSYIGSYTGEELPTGAVARNRICAAEIWAELFKTDSSEMSAYNSKFIHNIMSQMSGWKRVGTLSYKLYGNQRSYVRIGSDKDTQDSDEEDIMEEAEV